MKVILVKSPNNGEGGLLAGQLIQPNKASSADISLQLIELLAKQTGYYQDCRLLSTTSAYKVPSSLHLTIFGTGAISVPFQKRNINTKPSHKPFVYNGVNIKISNWYALPWRVCFFISQYSLVACVSFCKTEAACTFLPSTLACHFDETLWVQFS